MTFTTPPTFHRPEGNPTSLRELATLLTSVAEVLEQVGSTADEMSGKNSQLYWEGRPGDVFWDGTAQINYIESAVRRRRLVEAAGTTFREAGTVLGATADNLVKAQMAVDEAQSVANQRATAGAVSPVPTSFDQEQMVASTAGSLAAASGGEAASRLRALADSIPGYVAPAVSGATGTGSELGGRGASAQVGLSTGGSGGGSTAGAGSAVGSTGGSVGPVAGGGSVGGSVGGDGVSTWSSDAAPGPSGAPGSAGSTAGGAGEDTAPGSGSATSGSATTLDDGTPGAAVGGPGAGPASSQSAAALDDGTPSAAVGGSGAAGGGGAAGGSAAAAATSDDEDERRVRVEEQG